ncbi:MAG: helix-turn-helix domain-containing protein [Tistlia sp.]|uniref:helix-turn-helix domain-containing protein n=1 Tax=Tistlia sp. TaxID=3057121 RepID=UPI0034A3D6D9
MSVYALGTVLQQCFGLNPTQKMILVAMADCADTEEGNIFPSVATLALRTGYSEETVKRVRRDLRVEQVLVRDAEGGQGPGSTATYRIDIDRLLAVHGAPKEGSVQARVLAEMATRGRQPRLCSGHPLLANKGVAGDTLSGEKGVAGDTLSPDKGVSDSDKGVAGDTQTLSKNQEINPGACEALPVAAAGGGDKQQACGAVCAPPGGVGDGGEDGGSLGRAATAARVDPSSLRQRWLGRLGEIQRALGDPARFAAWVAPLIPWQETPSDFPDVELLLLRAPSLWHAEQLRASQARLLQVVERVWGGPVEVRPPGALGGEGLPRERHEAMKADALAAAGPSPPGTKPGTKPAGPAERGSAGRQGSARGMAGRR